MAAPNLGNLTTITGGTSVQTIGTAATAIVANVSASGTVYKIESLYITNTTGATINVTVTLSRGGSPYYIAYQIGVPANATLDVINKPVYVNENDSLQLTGASLGLSAVCSYELMS